MAKTKQPIKEFWESDKKPSYLKITERKTKDGSTHDVKFIKQRPKKMKAKKI